MSVLDGKPEPDHRGGTYQLAAPFREDGRAYATEYYSLKWFKNGDAHLTFLRPDLVGYMNKILGKHHPDALPAAR